MIVLWWAFMMWGFLTGPLSPTGLHPPWLGFVKVQTHVHCYFIKIKGAVITSTDHLCYSNTSLKS